MYLQTKNVFLYTYICKYFIPFQYFINSKGSAEDRIVGGHWALPGSFPYQVSIQRGWVIGKFGVGLQHFCGGSILSAKWVLTAGHCYYVQKLPFQKFFVAAGITNLVNSFRKGQYIAVKNWHVDPKYAG